MFLAGASLRAVSIYAKSLVLGLGGYVLVIGGLVLIGFGFAGIHKPGLAPLPFAIGVIVLVPGVWLITKGRQYTYQVIAEAKARESTTVESDPAPGPFGSPSEPGEIVGDVPWELRDGKG